MLAFSTDEGRAVVSACEWTGVLNAMKLRQCAARAQAVMVQVACGA